MVQLSDDTVHGNMLNLAEARSQLTKLVRATMEAKTTEKVALADCFDRILAQDVLAHTSVPRFENSAVDGFAFSHKDLSVDGAGTALGLQREKIFAGDRNPPILQKNQAIPIATGAVIPQGSDSVCMLEDASLDGGFVRIPNALNAGSNVRPKGEDFEAHKPFLFAGQRLSARHIAGLLATGAPDTLAVHPKLRLLICSTGDELSRPAQTRPTPHSETKSETGLNASLKTAEAEALVSDSNGPMLNSLLRDSWGFDSHLYHKILPDNLEQVSAFFQEASPNYDCLITTGAVSTGERDYLKRAFEVAGGSVHFWRLGIKPGRPVAVGYWGDCLWIGLPGNPVAALVTALEVALPALRRGSGECFEDEAKGYWVALDSPFKKKAGRREFLRVKIRPSSEKGGLASAVKFHKTGAGMISGLLWADGLAQIPEHITEHKPGNAVWFKPWEAYRL